jgi:hypothetical protein
MSDLVVVGNGPLSAMRNIHSDPAGFNGEA